jgi:hypothetical protein
MGRRFISAILAGTALVTLSAYGSVAGGWGAGCDYCDHPGDPHHSVHYARPTYSYARPTVTIVPHFVVQPHYVVHRTYVVPRTYHLTGLPYAEPVVCNDNPGDLVNQGQYRSKFALLPMPAYCGVRKPAWTMIDPPSYQFEHEHRYRGAGYRWR